MHRIILISNAGGTIAASIVHIVRSFSESDFLLIGLAPQGEAIPNGLFDEVIRMPLIDSDELDRFKSLLDDLPVFLAIPTTDIEAVSWASLTDERCLTSSFRAALVSYDKWETFQECSARGLPFANSVLPSQFANQFPSFVAKPRRGGLSVGILHNPSFVSSLPDDDYVVQEFMPAPEYTVACYFRRNSAMIPPLVMERVIRYGLTIACTPVDDLTEQAATYLSRLSQNLELRGPFNMQCRIVEGMLVPFEFNCRFSGTCGIRDQLGYRDVRQAVAEALDSNFIEAFSISQGLGIRSITDGFLRGGSIADVCG